MPLKPLYKYNAALDAHVAKLYGKDAVSENYKTAENNINTIGTKNARPLSFDQASQVFANAREYGISTADAEKRMSANAKDNATAFGGGTLDGLLYGILKDTWYSKDWKTDASKNSGKLFGNLLGLLRWDKALGAVGRGISASGGISPVFKAAKALSSVGSVAKTTDAVYDVARYGDIVSDAQKALEQAKGAYKATGSAENAILLKKALAKYNATKKALVPVTNTASDVSRVVSWGEALAGAKAAAQTIRPIPTAKVAYKVGTGIKPMTNLGIGAGNNAPWSNSVIMKELQRMDQERLTGSILNQ